MVYCPASKVSGVRTTGCSSTAAAQLCIFLRRKADRRLTSKVGVLNHAVLTSALPSQTPFHDDGFGPCSTFSAAGLWGNHSNTERFENKGLPVITLATIRV